MCSNNVIGAMLPIIGRLQANFFSFSALPNAPKHIIGMLNSEILLWAMPPEPLWGSGAYPLRAHSLALAQGLWPLNCLTAFFEPHYFL